MADTFYVEVSYRAPTCDRDVLEAHVDELMEALEVEPNLIDPDVGLNFKFGRVDVCTVVEGSDQAEALGVALVAVRSALHHAGASTPGWDEAIRLAVGSARPADARLVF